MIVGIGIDLVKISRIQEMTDKWNKRFLNRIFTLTEQQYSFSFKHPFPHLAGRFAIKEAVFKAIGTGWRGGIKWTDIEVCNEPSGRPRVRVYGKVREWTEKHNVGRIEATISHDTEYSVGQILLLKTS